MNTPEQYLDQQNERLPEGFKPFITKDLTFPLTTLSKIRELKFNSAGNFSSLRLAEHRGQKVIIKAINFEEGNEHYAFVEMALLKNLKDKLAQSHVLNYIGAAKENDKIVMINEFLERGDIKQALKPDIQFFKQDIHPRDLDFVWKQRMRVAKHISQALKTLHELSIVHRDIKSDNILFTGRGRKTVMKLGDFGMARGIHSIDEAEPRTYTICGTDELMAPEMLLCMPYDHSVDVYSFGLVLTELICGRGPSPIYNKSSVDYTFLSRTAEDSFDVELSEISDYAIAGCPLELIELCKQCLSYESRYRISAEELSDMVTELDRELVQKKAERIVAKVNPRKWLYDERRGSYRAAEDSGPANIHLAKSMFDLCHQGTTPTQVKRNIEKQISKELPLVKIGDTRGMISKNSKSNSYANVARRQLRQVNRKLDRVAVLKEEMTVPVRTRDRSETLTSQSTHHTVGRRVKALQNRLAGKKTDQSSFSRSKHVHHKNI